MAEDIDRYNDQAMELDKEQERQIIASVRKRMGKGTAYTNYAKASSTAPKNSAQPQLNGSNSSSSFNAPKPDIKKPTKGFLTSVDAATQQSKVDGQVKDILKNLN